MKLIIYKCNNKFPVYYIYVCMQARQGKAARQGKQRNATVAYACMHVCMYACMCARINYQLIYRVRFGEQAFPVIFLNS